MKPRYYKYYWSKTKFDVYRILEDGTIQKRLKKTRIKNSKVVHKYSWKKLEDGEFAQLFDHKVVEISEEEYFLSQL